MSIFWETTPGPGNLLSYPHMRASFAQVAIPGVFPAIKVITSRSVNGSQKQSEQANHPTNQLRTWELKCMTFIKFILVILAAYQIRDSYLYLATSTSLLKAQRLNEKSEFGSFYYVHTLVGWARKRQDVHDSNFRQVAIFRQVFLILEWLSLAL